MFKLDPVLRGEWVAPGFWAPKLRNVCRRPWGKQKAKTAFQVHSLCKVASLWWHDGLHSSYAKMHRFHVQHRFLGFSRFHDDWGLRNLRLGLSNKEVAQIFNSLSANSFRVAGTKRLVAIRCLKLLAELLQALPICQILCRMGRQAVSHCHWETTWKDERWQSRSKGFNHVQSILGRSLWFSLKLCWKSPLWKTNCRSFDQSKCRKMSSISGDEATATTGLGHGSFSSSPRNPGWRQKPSSAGVPQLFRGFCAAQPGGSGAKCIEAGRLKWLVWRLKNIEHTEIKTQVFSILSIWTSKDIQSTKSALMKWCRNHAEPPLRQYLVPLAWHCCLI